MDDFGSPAGMGFGRRSRPRLVSGRGPQAKRSGRDSPEGAYRPKPFRPGGRKHNGKCTERGREDSGGRRSRVPEPPYSKQGPTIKIGPCLAVRKGLEPALRAMAHYVTPLPPAASSPSGGRRSRVRGADFQIAKKGSSCDEPLSGAEGARTRAARGGSLRYPPAACGVFPPRGDGGRGF